MLFFWAIWGCTSKEMDSGVELETVEASSFDCAQDYAMCASLLVPSDFVGTPKNLTLALYSSLPPMGPPNVILAQVTDPNIGIDQPYAVELHPVTATGSYHLFVSLYMEGGGEWMPASGIDYMLETEALSFEGTAVNLGEMTLSLAE